MGLFKSTKPPVPSPPLPTLSLHLDAPKDHIYQPGSTVSGHISLSTPTPLTPSSLTVDLHGHSKIWIRTSHKNNNDHTTYTHYRDLAPLFTVSLNLLPNPHPLHIGVTYTFLFSFCVPEGTGYDRKDVYKQPKHMHDRYTTGPHDLPPTFYNGSKYGGPDEAEIVYGVTARLVCSNGLGVGSGGIVEKQQHHDYGDGEPITLSATAPITFQARNLHHPDRNTGAPLAVIRYPKQFSLASSLLSGAQDASSYGFRQRLTDRFSSTTPKLNFELALEIPDLLTSGAEFRFRASFAVLSKTSNVVEIPMPITFHVLKLELLDFTLFRAPRDWDAMTDADGSPYPEKWRHYKPDPGSRHLLGESERFREGKVVLNALPESCVLRLEEVAALGSSGVEKKEMPALPELGDVKRQLDSKKEISDSKDAEPAHNKNTSQSDHCECWFNARVPGFTVPSLSSFAVARWYRVKVKLGVTVGGKEFKHEVESHVQNLGGGAA